jgi:hypothetical protein
VTDDWARTLAGAWIAAVREKGAWPWDADRNETTEEQATAALIEALRLLVPDPEAATIAPPSHAPELWVLARTGLYIVSCASIEKQSLRAHANTRRFQLDPENSSFEVKSLLETRPRGLTRGDLHWTFSIGDVRLKLTTHPGDVDENRSAAHTFAMSLAEKLSCTIPPRSEES